MFLHFLNIILHCFEAEPNEFIKILIFVWFMKTARKRQTLTLTFNKKLTFGENKELALTWKTAVKALLNGAIIGSIQGKAYCMLYPVLHLYVLKHIVCYTRWCHYSISARYSILYTMLNLCEVKHMK